MKLLSLQRYGFRNAISRRDDGFTPFNGIFGPNGRGKTNFLEAIYYLAHLKSWRVSQKRDLIHWSNGETRLLARFESHDREHEIAIRLFPDRREVVLDGKSIRSWRSYRTAFVAILFAPEDSYLWRKGPGERRTALDQMIFHRDPEYLDLMSRYQTVLRQKNALLREGGFAADHLASWNAELVLYGAQIVLRRISYLTEIKSFFQKIYSSIVTGQNAREKISIHCRLLGRNQAIDGPPVSLHAYRQEFEARLQEKATLERDQGLALVGPHRDDWGLALDGHEVAETASQGEHRSLIVAMKLAELLLLKAHRGEAPLFLVDDLTSELDSHRRRFLIETLLDTGCQTFLTSTDSGLFQELMPKDSKIMMV